MSHRYAPVALLAAVSLSALAGCAANTAAPAPGASAVAAEQVRYSASEQRGREIAVRRCAGCHTVGLDDGGASEGPSFRVLSVRYNPISLERRFAEVSAHGVDRMPPVGFTTSEAEDLAAYMATLSRR